MVVILEKLIYLIRIIIYMTDELERLVNGIVPKIKKILSMQIKGIRFPTYQLHIVEEAITDKEEELGGDVPLDEKFRHILEEVPGIILDTIDVEEHAGDYPGAWGTPKEPPSYPYVILQPDGSIVRRVGSIFPDREGYFPCESPNCTSRHEFSIDYITYGERALSMLPNRTPTISRSMRHVWDLIERGSIELEKLLKEASKNKVFPKFKAYFRNLEITATEEEYMGEVDDSEKYSTELGKKRGVILDVKAPCGDDPDDSLAGICPIVVLLPDGSLTRFHAKEPSVPYIHWDHPDGFGLFPQDYFTYMKQAMDAIGKLDNKLFYVVFVDNHAGGYGYWLGESEQDLRARLKGEGYDDIRYGSFAPVKLEKAKELIERAIKIAPKPFHTRVNTALDHVEEFLNNFQD